ncbi:MAG: ABC transporter ATP-binding protein [Pseudomonadota bacterium]
MASQLRTEDLVLAYDKHPVLDGITVNVPDQQITAIVGPNACGKSTLLRAMTRLLTPQSGAAYLHDKPVHKQKTGAVAKSIALLPQSADTPDGMRVIDLVGFGRTPHQSPLQQWSAKDEKMVMAALAQVGLQAFADRPVAALSGGQRQRAWIAMVLAQDTDILLLDEPTTFLDLSYQIETLKLLQTLQQDRARTILMVLHDINLAARFADHIIAMRDGAVVCQGTPTQVVTEANIDAVYDLSAKVIAGPVGGAPFVIPL